MGLLDDAIRQHLELKRRHGADPSEVARQEHEALGPPRHGTAAEEAELADPDGLAADEAELHGNGDELLAPEPYPEAELSPGPVEPTRVPEFEPERAAPAGESADEVADQPAAAESAPAPPPDELDQPTQVYDPGDDFPATGPDADPDPDPDREAPAEAADPRPAREPAAPDGRDAGEEPGGEPSEEDVLEETPEFLQETPEHDRLWFEQKPPRDFDF